MELIRSDAIRQSMARVVTAMANAAQDGTRISRMPDGSLAVSQDTQAFLKPLQRDGGIDNVIRSMIIAACDRSERVAVGSTGHLLRYLTQPGASISDARVLIEEIPTLAVPATLETIRSMLAASVPMVTDLLMETLELAGSECKVFVEPSTSGVTVIEKVLGHSFVASPDPSFYRSGRWVAHDARCLIVDGTIDRVSEIDTLLRRCHETHTALAIFARGFSRDVFATLRVNHARKTLNVVPVSVEFDLETVNVLLDIASVVGCDVISSLKGELISTVAYDDLTVVRSITCVGRAVTIVNDLTLPAVLVQLRNLVHKRSNETLPGMRQILDRRIRSLSSSSVVARVSDAGSTGSRLMHEIDAGLKMVRVALGHGILMPGVQGVLHPCPAISRAAGLHFAASVIESVTSAGAALIGP